MIELAGAIIVVAGIAGYLVNRFLDQRQQELDRKYQLNSEADKSATIAALEEQIHKFDQRINDTWGSISSIKQELESHKLVMGMRNNRL